MDRDELVTRLEFAVRDDLLSVDEARRIIDMYDQGKISDDDLALLFEDQGKYLQIVIQFYNAIALLGSSLRNRQRVIMRIVNAFDNVVSSISDAGERVDYGVRRWHDAMGRAITDQSLRMAELGLGRRLRESDLDQVRAIIASDLAYLQRFADEIAFRRLIGRPLSSARIRDRSRQYGGAALGLFYELAERGLPNGYIVRYIAVDDGGTCGPCHAASLAGPYLPGQGPMPGVVCLARGKCRCRRETEYNPDIAATL